MPWGMAVVLGLLASCAAKRTSSSDAAHDAGTSSDSDGAAAQPSRPDALTRTIDEGQATMDGPTASATGSLPFGWQSSLPVGAPGWQSAPTPLCDVNQGLGMGDTVGVWADSRGVFVFGTTECVYIDEFLAGCPNDGQGHQSPVLELNDGAGWRQLWQGPSFMPYVEFTGIPNGPLLLTGPDCGLSRLDPSSGTESCWLQLMGESWNSQPTFVVNPAVTYQVDSGSGIDKSSGRFLDYRAGTWTVEVPSLPEAINAIWGTENLAYLGGDYQLYTWQSSTPSALVPMPNAPSAHYTAAWGLADTDVWFGNSAGQLVHYDGTSFTVLQVSAPERRGIQGLWGQGDRLYFHTQTEFGRVVNGTAETLLTAPLDDNGAVAGMWGISSTDVFIALGGVLDPNMTPCRHNSMFWFDGVAFHQF